MDKDGKITKIDEILIDQPADATDHFRDPQIFNFNGQYYAIVGGQDLEKKDLSVSTRLSIMIIQTGKKSETLTSTMTALLI